MAESSARRAATVEFDHVSKQYDETQIKKGAPGAVNDLSFTVPAGKILTLVGPSGCGKTTSLKMVNRLIEPTSGQIRIDGQDIAKRDVTELRRSIGYVIQQIGLFPHQTIEENVGTVPRLLGWPDARWKARASELLSLISLEPGKYAKRYPSQLSGGERQRVGVARALAADPPIMLMDEPFGAVDPIVRERLQNEFLRLQEDLAKTILFVTHDIDEAIKMGDLVAVLQVGGKLAQFGPPAEILANPASEFVARFVGADRGLKRLSLNRVDDIPLREPAMATVERRAGDGPRPGGRPIRSATCCSSTTAASPSAGSPPITSATASRITTEMASQSSPLFDRRTTLKDALSMLLDADVRAGIVVDRTGAVRGIITAERHRRLDARVGWLHRAGGRLGSRRRPGRTSRWNAGGGRGLTGWTSGSTGSGSATTWTTRSSACCSTSSWSSSRSRWASRSRSSSRSSRRAGTGVYGPITAVTGVLYTIPSIAAFSLLLPIFGLSLLTAIVPLTTYTLLILFRSNVAGPAVGPGRRHRGRRGDGLLGPSPAGPRRAATRRAADDRGIAAGDRHDHRPRDGGRSPRRQVRRASGSS